MSKGKTILFWKYLTMQKLRFSCVRTETTDWIIYVANVCAVAALSLQINENRRRSTFNRRRQIDERTSNRTNATNYKYSNAKAKTAFGSSVEIQMIRMDWELNRSRRRHRTKRWTRFSMRMPTDDAHVLCHLLTYACTAHRHRNHKVPSLISSFI